MRGEASSGFSLVETLVALAVIAAMSALLFDTVSTNAHFAQTVAKRREAVLLAQSLLAATTVSRDSHTVADTGNSHGLNWRITRVARGGGARDSGVPLEEVRISVADSATGRGLTSVRTLRLAR
ncbi:type II secretion system protein [Sphingomonas gei]|uniref:Type II secretion system protein n=1 Tax=Sphingomonas gei TaxID=1395960 RepID=A0A4S1WYT6_9SPHN|nr:type II secretion system protein [Sphingomonas gei]TGX48711.1 type II secretion system protein [Sphingomonas gei]